MTDSTNPDFPGKIMQISLFLKRSRLVSYVFLFVALCSLPALSQTPSAPDTVFSNTAPITINTAASSLTAPTVAVPYPSTINVSGTTGNITKVAVTLDGVTHNNLADLDVLLVSPNGIKVIVLSDAPNFAPRPVRDLSLTFDDAAPSFPVDPIFNGTYAPINFNSGSADTFPAPAPAGPYSNGLSNFNGASPNGTWSLYIVDDSLGNSGALNRGWKLTVTTAGGTQTFSNSNYLEIPDVSARATPYPSNISVSGLTGVTSKITVTLNNFSHQNASDVSVLLISPNGAGIILMSNAGSTATNNATITFDQAAANGLPFNGGIITGTYRLSAYSPTDFFPSPASLSDSSGRFLNSLDGFNNFTPNGTWSLFVLDTVRGNSGMIDGGWSLNITTTPFTPTVFGCTLPSFSTVNNYNVGSNPTNLATADFNNDTKPDILAVNQFSNDISVLLNDGTGGFLPATNIAVGSSPYSVAVGKFNADNNFDIAVANSGSNTVSVLLGNGNGTFSAPVNFNAGATPISVAVGDFNNDAKQDLAVANFGGFFAGTVSILLGNGTGGFAPQISARVRTQPAFVLVGNFNGDANQDLAVANFGSNNVSILTGLGNGNFTETSAINTGVGPVSITLNSNAAPNAANLIVANYNGNTLSYLQNDGAGLFTLANSQTTNGNPISVITADILGGGSLSPVTALNSTNQVHVPQSDFTVGSNPNAVISADFNGDGRADIVSANSGSNNVSVLLNSCSVAKGNLFDFDGDRRTDFAVFRRLSSVWYNASIPQAFVSQTSIGIPTDQIVPADYDGDGRTDIAIFRAENGFWYAPNIYFTFFGQTGDIATPADFDGDQKADIAVFRPSNGTWYIRRSSDNGFQTVQFGANGDLPVQADFDGDGRADLAVFRPSTGIWYWLRSSDNGFSAVQFGMQGDKTVAADYDGDGKTDQAVFRNGIWYILNSSNGQYRSLAFGLGTDIPVPGDYDNDGKFDVAVFRPSNGIWYYLRSVDGAFQGVQFGQNGDVPIPSAYVR